MVAIILGVLRVPLNIVRPDAVESSTSLASFVISNASQEDASSHSPEHFNILTGIS